jgi:hypothetical protein
LEFLLDMFVSGTGGNGGIPPTETGALVAASALGVKKLAQATGEAVCKRRGIGEELKNKIHNLQQVKLSKQRYSREARKGSLS